MVLVEMLKMHILLTTGAKKVIAGWNLGIDGNYPRSSMFSYV
jgi:hypothetical protein